MINPGHSTFISQESQKERKWLEENNEIIKDHCSERQALRLK